MTFIRKIQYLGWGSCLAFLTALGAAPVVAQEANFEALNLKPGFSTSAGVVRGFTRSAFSLPTISNRDRANNPCLGFGNNRDIPDHVMVLQQPFSRLAIKAESKGNRPTLLIQDDKNTTVFCGSDRLEGSNWAAGKYKIWVGCDEGSVCKYTLSVRE